MGGCDAAGCSDGVYLEAPRLAAEAGELLTIRACVDGVCNEQRSTHASIQVPVGVPQQADDVAVSVTVTDADGEELAHASGTARATVDHPNGEHCPPSCRVVHVRLANDRLEDTG